MKPANTEKLIHTIREKLAHHHHHFPPPLQKLSFILKNNLQTIMDRYVEEIRADTRFPVAELSRDEILDHLPAVLGEVIALLQHSKRSEPDLAEAAGEHGRVRCRQSFTVPMMVEEIRILRNLLYSVAQENLLTVDMSTLIPDMIRVADTIDVRLKESIHSYLNYCELPRIA